jgi:hypothetical protein
MPGLLEEFRKYGEDESFSDINFDAELLDVLERISPLIMVEGFRILEIED